MKKNFILLSVLVISGTAYGQVGIGTPSPDASAILDLTSTNKGFLLPRMTTTERNLILLPATGLNIYNVTTNSPEVNTGPPGGPIWTSATLNISGVSPISVTNGVVSLIDGGISTTKLADGAVTSVKIATSPAFTGIPTAPTASLGTNTTQLATTAFVNATAVAASASVTASNGLTRTANNIALGGTLSQNTNIGGNFNLSTTGTGNFGIGIANPTAQLHLANTGVNRKIVLFDNTAGNDHEFYGFGINSGILRYQTPFGANHVWYSGASAAGTGSNELMRLQSNGNLGIGTPTPASSLDIKKRFQAGTWVSSGDMGSLYLNGDYTISSSYNLLSGATDKNLYVNRPDGFDIRFRKNNADQMVIGNAGQVAIMNLAGIGNRMVIVDANGTLTPTAIPPGADNLGNHTATTALNMNGNPITGLWTNNATNSYINARVIRNESSALADGMFIGYENTGTTNGHLRFYANGIIERMRIDAATGNVGIGTTTPTEFKLQVSGALPAYVAGMRPGGGLGLYSSDNTKLKGMFGWIRRPDGSPTLLLQALEEGLIWRDVSLVRDAGNVGIGTDAPTQRLDVIGNIRARAIAGGFVDLNAGSAAQSGYIGFFKASSVRIGYIGYDNTNLTYVAENGAVHSFLGNVIGNGSFTATGFFQSSDLRLKDVIRRDGDIAYYTWKDGRDKKVHTGYIAQEVQVKNPDQVNTDKAGMLSVNYIEILVEKVRQLEKEIELLKAKK